MRGLVQRVSEASVSCSAHRGEAAEEAGSIGPGLLVMVAVTHGDDRDDALRLAHKVWGLRVFEDADGVPNLSCRQVGGSVLVVSQFTLYADTGRGRRPSYVRAARPEAAEPLVDAVTARLRQLGATVASGRFRTHMEVRSVNDGPFTVLLEV